MSGKFTNGEVACGGFVNTITDEYADNLGVGGPTSGGFGRRFHERVLDGSKSTNSRLYLAR